MEWTLRLVGTEMDGQSRSFDVMEISRPDDLSDFADLGLTLAEAKQLLVQVHQEVVAAQARHQAMFRPDCQSCGGRCHIKDWRRHRVGRFVGPKPPLKPKQVRAVESRLEMLNAQHQ